MWTASLEVTRTGASRGFVTCAITRVCNRSDFQRSDFPIFNFEKFLIFPLPVLIRTSVEAVTMTVVHRNESEPVQAAHDGCHKFNQICKILFEGQFVEMLSNFCGHRNRKLTNEPQMRFRSEILKLRFWNRNSRIFTWAIKIFQKNELHNCHFNNYFISLNNP